MKRFISGFVIATAISCGINVYSYNDYTKSMNTTVNNLKENMREYVSEQFDKGFKDGYKQGEIDALIKYNKNREDAVALIEEYYTELKNTAENFIFTEHKIEKIMNKSNPNLSDKKKELYKKYIIKWANEYGLSPVFVASIIHRETNFKEYAVSSANALGPMQVIPKWHRDKMKKIGISKDDELKSINYGIHVGCMVISNYLKLCDGNYRNALYRYVGAVNNTDHAEVYANDIFDMVMYAYNEDKSKE